GMLKGVEQASRRLEAIRLQAISAAEADGLWALDGSRTLPVWLRAHTGTPRGICARQVRTARRVTQHLPQALEALIGGMIGADHIGVLVRECTRTRPMRDLLTDREVGEEFLVPHATVLDVDA